MENKKIITIIAVILAVNVCATAWLGSMLLKDSYEEMPADESVQYVMYVGTNDKDTYEQIIPTEEAKQIIDSICFEYLGGYTIQDATGSWVDETGTATHENTIVCYFDDTDEATVRMIGNEIIKALNQNTVLIEKNTITMEYYGGEQ